MKILRNIVFFLGVVLAMTSCQENKIEIAAPAIAPIDASVLSGALEGDNYVWNWPAQQGKSMFVTVYNGSTLSLSETVEGTSFVHPNVDTNIEYTYVFKLTDGSNLSSGVIKRYTRPGASKISGLAMAQLDKAGGYDALVSWNANETATSIELNATNGSKVVKETLPGNATSFTISDVMYGEEWIVTVTAVNAEGPAMTVSTSLKIGKTTIGFLSIYPTPSELVAEGDDDEASAWLWLNETYPTAEYVYFGDVKSVADLDQFRVLFWMRDLEEKVNEETGEVIPVDVWNMPAVVEDATPYIIEWYKDGGNLLLWSHATVYVGNLGRIEASVLRGADPAVGTGRGGFNGDTWKMAVSLSPDSKFTKDHSSHPIYRGLEVESSPNCKLIAFKGPGWTEDHNCLFFNIPSALTGLDNQDEACYNTLTQVYGIYPLGTWDSQANWISQLNVWEAQQGNTEFKGTILCIGNGGCEFSMKNPDGSFDISAHPKNNIYQENVLTLAKNSLEYLKTR